MVKAIQSAHLVYFCHGKYPCPLQGMIISTLVARYLDDPSMDVEGRRRAWIVLVLHGENYSSETPVNRIGMFLGVHESHLLDEDLGQVSHPLIHLIVHIFIPWNIDMKVATQYSHSSISLMLLTVWRTAAIRFSSSPWHVCWYSHTVSIYHLWLGSLQSWQRHVFQYWEPSRVPSWPCSRYGFLG